MDANKHIKKNQIYNQQMKFVLSGIETNNKGAELMLYAILQEIERKYPEAEVYMPVFAIKQGLNYIQTTLNIKEKPFAKIIRFLHKLRVFSVLRKLHIPYHFFYDTRPIKNANYFFDASGFIFSDQWNPSIETVKIWQYHLREYHKQGTKIIFLPQAFGPINLPNTKKEINILNQYADLIMPREKTSLIYLQNSGLNENKIKLFTDFTSLVKGIFPTQYTHLKSGVCIIPNLRMIDKGIISLENYLSLLSSIIKITSEQGYVTYLLNHEGPEDECLAYKCKSLLNQPIEIVSGLNALEVKGLIGSAYLCISSRFHGVASALNSSVPCLATSWSHKYAELFHDYEMNDCILNLQDKTSCLNKVNDFLSDSKNSQIRTVLKMQEKHIQNKTRAMWECVWNV